MLKNNSTLVYFFSKQLDDLLKKELGKDKSVAKYVRSVIWVYKVSDNGELVLLPNQPFKSKREVGRELGIDPKYITKHLDTNIAYKNYIFHTSPKT